MPPIARELSSVFSALMLVAASFVFFILVYAIKRHLFPSPIIFYEGIIVAAVTASIFCLSYFVVTYRNASDRYVVRGSVFLLLASLSLNYAFIVTFPALLDRSISMTLLSVVDQVPAGKISIESLNDEFIRIYVAGDTQTRKRVEEQVATGNFHVKDGYIEITERGRRFASAFRIMATLFNLTRTYVDANLKK